MQSGRQKLRLYWYGAADERTRLEDAEGKNIFDQMQVEEITFVGSHNSDGVLTLKLRGEIEIEGDAVEVQIQGEPFIKISREVHEA